MSFPDEQKQKTTIVFCRPIEAVVLRNGKEFLHMYFNTVYG